ncbi:MAG: hypothetical protein AAFQ65_04540 [Myxococcota bacterium]
MSAVFLVHHSYEYDTDDSFGNEEVKFIGVYSARKTAEAAVRRLQVLPGFRDHDPECFLIEEHILDEDNWTEGFVDVEEAMKDRVV